MNVSFKDLTSIEVVLIDQVFESFFQRYQGLPMDQYFSIAYRYFCHYEWLRSRSSNLQFIMYDRSDTTW